MRQIKDETFADLHDASDVMHRIDQGFQMVTIGTHPDLGPWVVIQTREAYWISSEQDPVDLEKFLSSEAMPA